MMRPLFRTRTVLRITLALLTVNLCAFALLLDGPLAVAGGLPQEFVGFRLGERIDAVTASSWGVTIKSRTMVKVGRHDLSFAPRLTAGVVLYEDCPVRVQNRCAPGPQNISADRPDNPGSLRLFVASFAESRLLALAFNLNGRRWENTVFEKAEQLLSKSYGRPVKSSPVNSEVIKTPQMHLVSAFKSWQWEDKDVRLRVQGSGNNMPGSNIPGIGSPGSPSYSYFLYVERLDLRRLADQRVPKAREQEKER